MPRFSPLAGVQKLHILSARDRSLKISDVRFVRIDRKVTAIQFLTTVPRIKSTDMKRKFAQSKVWITTPLNGSFKSIRDDNFIASLESSVTVTGAYPLDPLKPHARVFGDNKTYEMMNRYISDLKKDKERQVDLFDTQWNDAREGGAKAKNDYYSGGVDFFFDDYESDLHIINTDRDLASRFRQNGIKISVDEVDIIAAKRDFVASLTLAGLALGINGLKYALAGFFALTANWWAGKAFKDGLEVFGIPTSLQSKNKWYWHYANHVIYAPRVKLTAG